MPVKDALCRDVEIDYGEDIINIQDILDATNARKNIFNDSVELQKLTLKQIALVYTYESDAEQVSQNTFTIHSNKCDVLTIFIFIFIGYTVAKRSL